MKDLTNKTVLLLSPNFFGYEKEIKMEIEKRGAIVTYHTVNPTPQYRTLMGSMKKLHIPTKWLIHRFENSVYKSVCNEKYDYILVICGWAVTSRLSHLLREHLLKDRGKMILYYWDSMDRLNDDKRRWKDFDEIYTFDMKDAQKYSDKVKLLSLFYCDKYWNDDLVGSKFDGMIIGSFRLDRLDFVRKIRKNNPTLIVGSYLYTPKWEILFHKTLRKKYRDIHLSELDFEKLSFDEVINLYRSSRAVVDIPAIFQNGLTIRTFETLAMHKKLITSNRNVTEYDFYNPNDIFVVGERFDLPKKEWFEKPFNIGDDIIRKYSLSEWVSKLLK